MSKVERTMMVGTEGNTDYLHIGEFHGMSVGVKVFTIVRGTSAFFGSRVRFQLPVYSENPVDKKRVFADNPWLVEGKEVTLNHKDYHSSATFGFMAPIPDKDNPDLPLSQVQKIWFDGFKPIFESLLDYIDVIHPEDDFYLWVNERMESMLEELTN